MRFHTPSSGIHAAPAVGAVVGSPIRTGLAPACKGCPAARKLALKAAPRPAHFPCAPMSDSVTTD